MNSCPIRNKIYKHVLELWNYLNRYAHCCICEDAEELAGQKQPIQPIPE